MKKCMMLAILCLCMVQAGCAMIGQKDKFIMSGNWQEILTIDEPEKITVYLDKDSIQIRNFDTVDAGQYVSVNIKRKYYRIQHSDFNNVKFWQRLNTQYYDCKNRKWVNQGISELDENDVFLDGLKLTVDTKNSLSKGWKEVIPNSAGEFVLETVCQLANQ